MRVGWICCQMWNRSFFPLLSVFNSYLAHFKKKKEDPFEMKMQNRWNKSYIILRYESTSKQLQQLYIFIAAKLCLELTAGHVCFSFNHRSLKTLGILHILRETIGTEKNYRKQSQKSTSGQWVIQSSLSGLSVCSVRWPLNKKESATQSRPHLWQYNCSGITHAVVLLSSFIL